MRVSVRLFAGLRERAGRSELELELPEGARVSDALAAVGDLAAGVPLVMAVNREYADAAAPLSPGDELALIPPVSGGAEALHVAIHSEPLSLDALADRVRAPRAGALVSFSGTTRDVDFLDYEAYAEMAAEQMTAIVAAAIERHGLCAAAAEHRVGRVPRGEAFAGAREIIDEIKVRAPIWKREEGEWKHGPHPPTVPSAAPATRGPENPERRSRD